MKKLYSITLSIAVLLSLTGCLDSRDGENEEIAPVIADPTITADSFLKFINTQAALSANALNGTWDVTLYFSQAAPPSSTVMVINVENDSALSGSFYQSDFLEAEYSIRNGVIAFAAVTEDGSAPYNTSGRYVDGKIEGQTHSLGRDFLMIWTATRREAP